MIYDKIRNWKKYFSNPLFEEVFMNLTKFNIRSDDGNYKNYSNEYYFKVMTLNTLKETNIIESHQKEVDIQILLKGKELIEIFDDSCVEIKDYYSAELDCQFYSQKEPSYTRILLQPGYMAIFFEEDIHKPLIPLNGIEEELKKIVIKVNKENF